MKAGWRAGEVDAEFTKFTRALGSLSIFVMGENVC